VIYVNGNMEERRVNMNSNEKLALSLTGMEGTGEHFIINGEEADKTLQREAVEKFNTAVSDIENKFEKHNKALEEYANSLSEDMNGLEIMPMSSYVLVKPFDKNPFQKIKVSDSGIITDLGGFTPTYKSNETGQVEEEQQYIKVGTVIETGSKCEFLQAGDIVFYTIASECMVPFYKLGFVVVNENRVLAVVNEKLTDRKHGRG
jgi:hypothetical protein